MVENIIPMIWFDRNMMETIFHSAMSALPFLYKIWFEKKKFLHHSKSRLKLSKLMSMCVYHFRNVIQYLGTSRNVNFFHTRLVSVYSPLASLFFPFCVWIWKGTMMCWFSHLIQWMEELARIGTIEEEEMDICSIVEVMVVKNKRWINQKPNSKIFFNVLKNNINFWYFLGWNYLERFWVFSIWEVKSRILLGCMFYRSWGAVQYSVLYGVCFKRNKLI